MSCRGWALPISRPDNGLREMPCPSLTGLLLCAPDSTQHDESLWRPSSVLPQHEIANPARPGREQR